MGLSECLKDSTLRSRYERVKRYFFLKESTYDVTSTCQLRCEGCYYFEGEKSKTQDVKNPAEWRQFIESERQRGINYVVLAGAEPSLVPAVLRACHEVIPLGTVASNGLRFIPEDVRYRIHLSVWGDSTGDPIYRRYAGGHPGPYCLPIQLRNYRQDDRVIFVYTFNGNNIDEADEVAARIADEGQRMTFNVFSAPEGYNAGLKLREQLHRTRDKMYRLMERYSDSVVCCRYAVEVHTSIASLRDQFGCPYPRASLDSQEHAFGLARTFRSYRTDFSHSTDTDCCVPDTNCCDCRHYAAGSAIVTSRLNRHVDSKERFADWLDYVEYYLSVWLLGYTPQPIKERIT